MAISFPTNPQLNDIYTYGGRSWKWNDTTWESVGSATGAQGPTGKSAYQSAVDNGFVGTEAEWVDYSLKTVDGVHITVSSTAPSSPSVGDLWFW